MVQTYWPEAGFLRTSSELLMAFPFRTNTNRPALASMRSGTDSSG